jgi:aquaporin Z
MAQHSWWKHFHWPEYGAELLGTVFLVFFAVSATIFDFDPAFPPAHLLPNRELRFLLTGLLSSGGATLVALSPLGMLSGGHSNPAITLSFWIQGKICHHDLIGYLLGQFLGAIIGATLIVLVWRAHAYRASVGRMMPHMGYPLWVVFLTECCLTFVLVLSILLFVSDHRLLRYTPLMSWILLALMMWVAFPISGAGLNPARSFGPAFVTWFWRDQWIYWVAPPLGTVFAVGVFRFLIKNERDILTGKMFHNPSYRSVFKNVSAPAQPHNGKLKR